MTLLQQRDADRREQRLTLRARTLHELESVLREILPGTRVVVFGSLLQPGVFNEASDVDLALFEEPQGKNRWWIQAELEERLRRPVDLVLLSESRLREKILQEGELWTTSD